MKKYKISGLLIALSIAVAGCFDHNPKVENLPNADVSFEYSVVDDSYQLDYYVGANIQFRNTSFKKGECTWDFGYENNTKKGDVVEFKYPVTGTYKVRLTVEGVGFVERNIFISDIRPILTIDDIPGGICEVNTTWVGISVELPNPEGLPANYTWIFPEGTVNESNTLVELGNERKELTFVGKDPGKLMFKNVGSQLVRLKTTLGGRPLEDGSKNVQVGYFEAVPTIYYAVKKGNIFARKLPKDPPAGMKINSFNMGVKSGEHPLNILFHDTLLYVLDCGRQFTYIDDDGPRNRGDGQIFVMTKDGKGKNTMLSNKGQYAMDDPFYGYIEGSVLHFTDRRTGIAKIELKERNKILTRTEFPFWVENAKLGYYNQITGYGAINACIGKINGVWYWCKTFNGFGIARFKETDILGTALGTGQNAPMPADGWVLKNLHVKSFVWDDIRQVFYFSIFTPTLEGVYRCKLSDLNTITAAPESLNKYKLTVISNGKTVIPSIAGGSYEEGAENEYAAICQLALDRATGDVYFGLRSADKDNDSGLYRVVATEAAKQDFTGPTKAMEIVPGTEKDLIYGVSINNTPSKLF